MPAVAAERQYDLALFGATGFTGGLTAEYLAANAPAGLRWALVGRNRAKLEAVARAARRGVARRRRRPTCSRPTPPTRAALAQVAEAARVVITTVGPYALYGGAAGRRLRRRRHRLRRPHRRAGVRRPDVGRAPRRGRADRRPARPLLRLRLDPARPRRLLHRPAAARGRAAEGRRLRPLQRQLLRRDLPLGDQRLRPRPPDARRRQGAPPRRAAAGRPRDPLGAAPGIRRDARARRLGGAAADDRRRRSSAAPPRRSSATAPTSPTATTWSPSAWRRSRRSPAGWGRSPCWRRCRRPASCC